MTIAQEHNFGSPDSHDNLDNFLLDEHDDLKDSLEDQAEQDKPRRPGCRKGPAMAEKRNQHNAIERARRESLNGRFMTLAEALPSMAHVKRPSKSVIVNKALEFVFDAQVKEHALIKENNELRRQVDQLRLRLSMPPLPPPVPLPSAAAMPQFNRSFSGADLEDLKEEISGANGLVLAEQTNSPEMLQQHPSPASYVQAHAAAHTSPASSIMAGGIGDGMSPQIAYPTLFGQSPVPSSAGSPTHSAGSPNESADVAAARLAASAALAASSGPTPSPFIAHAPHQMAALSQQQGLTAQTQALLQAQFGYLQPSLLTQQHALLMAAAHGQQMQAQQMGQLPGMQEAYAQMGAFGGQQGQGMGGWGMGVAGGVNPYEFAAAY